MRPPIPRSSLASNGAPSRTPTASGVRRARRARPRVPNRPVPARREVSRYAGMLPISAADAPRSSICARSADCLGSRARGSCRTGASPPIWGRSPASHPETASTDRAPASWRPGRALSVRGFRSLAQPRPGERPAAWRSCRVSSARRRTVGELPPPCREQRSWRHLGVQRELSQIAKVSHATESARAATVAKGDTDLVVQRPLPEPERVE